MRQGLARVNPLWSPEVELYEVCASCGARRQLAGAIAKFQESLAIRPGDRSALSGWAEALAAVQSGPVPDEIAKLEEAIGKFEEVLARDSGFRSAVLGRAGAKVRLAWRRSPDAARNFLADALLVAVDPRVRTE